MPKKKQEESNKTSPGNVIVDTIIADHKKKFGDKVIGTARDAEFMNDRIVANNMIKTDSISFNAMTGIGGIPTGRIFLVYGKAGVGKTTTLLSCFKYAARQGYCLVFVDFEHRLDVGLLDSMGIDRKDPNNFILSLPNYANEGFDLIDKLLKTGKKFFIVIDSISAIKPRPSEKKAGGDWGDGKRPGQVAALLSEFLKDITPALSKSQSILGLLSQERMKGIVSGYAHKSSTGGLAPEFYSTYILAIRPESGKEIMKGDQQFGKVLIMNFKKNTTSLPPLPRKVALHYGKGFYLEYEAVMLGIQEGLIEVSGAWYAYKNIKKQGLGNLVECFEQDPQLLKELRKELNI